MKPKMKLKLEMKLIVAAVCFSSCLLPILADQDTRCKLSPL